MASVKPSKKPPTKRESDVARKGNGDARWSVPDPGRSTVYNYLNDSDKRSVGERTYRAEDFYVAATDAAGHEVKTWAKFHPGMWNEINMIVARGLLPFDTAQAFLRKAADDFLATCYLLEKRGGVANYMPRLRAISRIQQQSAQNRDLLQSYRQISDEVKSLLMLGQDQAAAKFIFDVLQEARQIPERSFRDTYVDMIVKDFGPLVKGKPVRTLRPSRKAAHHHEHDEHDEQ